MQDPDEAVYLINRVQKDMTGKQYKNTRANNNRKERKWK